MTPDELERAVMEELVARLFDRSRPFHERAQAARELQRRAATAAAGLDAELRRALRASLPKERPSA